MTETEQFQMPFDSPSPQSPPIKGGEARGGSPIEGEGNGYPFNKGKGFFIPSPLRGEGKGEGELTYEEQLLLALLKPGMENAGSVKFLAGILKLEEVTLRERIRHLIMEHGVCIGSNTSKCPGYYLITQPDELDKNYVSLRRRGIKILMRAARIKKISLEEVFQQARMEFNNAPQPPLTSRGGTEREHSFPPLNFSPRRLLGDPPEAGIRLSAERGGEGEL